jgi:hypothetical protein
MSDLQKLISLFDEWGVPFTRKEGDWHTGPDDTAEPLIVLEIGPDSDDSDADKVIGYMGFVTEFAFTPEGSFRWIGVWE